MFSLIKPKKCALALLGSAILAFGLYNVHALSGVTEGGVLGMTLFLLFPFSRLVHIWSAPVEYLTRKYQIVRARR